MKTKKRDARFESDQDQLSIDWKGDEEHYFACTSSSRSEPLFFVSLREPRDRVGHPFYVETPRVHNGMDVETEKSILPSNTTVATDPLSSDPRTERRTLSCSIEFPMLLEDSFTIGRVHAVSFLESNVLQFPIDATKPSLDLDERNR